MTQHSRVKQDAKQVDRKADPNLRNEGEGSRSGARAYDAHATEASKDPAKVKRLGKEAKEALAGKQGDELRDADRRGKNHQHR